MIYLDTLIYSCIVNVHLRAYRVLGGKEKSSNFIKGMMGPCFHNNGSASREPRCWNPHKSAEWHMSSGFITDTDNEALCNSLVLTVKQWMKKKANLCLNVTVIRFL